jgi:isochorismate synthase
MIDFFIKVQQHLQLNLPFVLFSKPNENRVVGLFQKDNELNFTKNFIEKGFVFAPFDGEQIILIPEENSEVLEVVFVPIETILKANLSVNTKLQEKAAFENLVQKGIDEIGKKTFQKVVLSREEIVELQDFDLVKLFKKLLNSYPTAFNYCWFHPEMGLWMGATPERLLKTSENIFQTVALAGTQLFQENSEVIWENKEKVEQQFVTDYILETIKSVTSNVEVSVPNSLKAGKLLHLKADIKGVINKDINVKELVLLLHPTPAVCGLPKQVAKDFIIENEGYNRSFYAGFLGEINRKENATELFVNLRCMQIKRYLDITKAHLYIGCGITKDSNPEKEWQETVNKATTMKNIIV